MTKGEVLDLLAAGARLHMGNTPEGREYWVDHDLWPQRGRTVYVRADVGERVIKDENIVCERDSFFDTTPQTFRHKAAGK